MDSIPVIDGGAEPAATPPLGTSERAAAVVAGGAVLLGVVADGLLRVEPLGLNIALVAATALFLLAAAARTAGRLRDRRLQLLFAPALAFALAPAWRDGSVLALNALAFFVALALLLRALRLGGAPPTALGLRDVALGVISGVVGGAVGVGALVQAMPARAVAARAGRGAGAVRGLLLATPVVVLFGALLAQGDPGFASVLESLPVPGFGGLVEHGMVVAAVAWVSAGLAAVAVLAPPARRATALAPRFTLGAAEVTSLLGAVAALFAAFSVLQAGYWFGGAEVVARTAGLTYAEYARRGFFELVVVAGLVVPLLLTVQERLHPGDERAARRFTGAARAVLVLLAPVLASAAWRMEMYVALYGLSEARLYAAAGIACVGAALLWLGATALRGRPARFAAGAVVAMWLTVGALDALGPAALVARVNLARATTAQAPDVTYLATLGPGAVPALAHAALRLPDPQRCEALRAVERWRAPGDGGWRTWNGDRWRAHRAAARAPTPERAGCPAVIAAAGR